MDRSDYMPGNEFETNDAKESMTAQQSQRDRLEPEPATFNRNCILWAESP
ncbi:hypothetical protein KFU94_05120 [Chloroflexi bacterium TSY]|nr:hypothetical protein [Chloroflexi bacterium TSY]